MSVIQPQSPPRPKPSLRAWFAAERKHLEEMKLGTFCLLAIPSIILFGFNPLLPVTAYMLQHWAGSSWSWRDRWASNAQWAKQGGWFVAILLTIITLAAMQIWIFPQVIEIAQTYWSLLHLPGDLSLSPLDGHALFARCLLLLPLAPALAHYYEWIDPRTRIEARRVLTQADLTAPTRAAPPPSATADPDATTATDQKQSSTGQEKPPAPKAKSPKRKRSGTTRTKQQDNTPQPQAQQMTIDSILTPDQTKEKDAPHTTVPAPTLQKTSTQTETINWDDVAE